MSIVFIDGFSTYGTQSGLEKAGWTFGGVDVNPAITNGRFSGTRALRLSGFTDSVRRPLGRGAVTEYCVGFAFRVLSTDVNGFPVIAFNGLVTTAYQLTITGAGFLRVRTRSGATLADGLLNVGIPNQWNYIEFRVFDGTSFQVFVNGVLDVSGSLPSISDIYSITLGDDADTAVEPRTPDNEYTDMYFKVAGGTYNSDTLPLGDCRVVTKLPEADVTAQFVPSTGTTNFSNVDDVPDDGDTTFVSAANTGTFDAYRSTTPLPFNPQKVHAVAVATVARKTDAGLRKLGIRVQSAGGTVVEYPGFSLGVSYQRYQEVIEKDPDGNVDWTKAKVDSLVFGPKLEV